MLNYAPSTTAVLTLPTLSSQIGTLFPRKLETYVNVRGYPVGVFFKGCEIFSEKFKGCEIFPENNKWSEKFTFREE